MSGVMQDLFAALKAAVEFAESHAERLKQVADQNTTWDEHIGLEGQPRKTGRKPAANDNRRAKH